MKKYKKKKKKKKKKKRGKYIYKLEKCVTIALLKLSRN